MAKGSRHRPETCRVLLFGNQSDFQRPLRRSSSRCGGWIRRACKSRSSWRTAPLHGVGRRRCRPDRRRRRPAPKNDGATRHAGWAWLGGVGRTAAPDSPAAELEHATCMLDSRCRPIGAALCLSTGACHSPPGEVLASAKRWRGIARRAVFSTHTLALCGSSEHRACAPARRDSIRGCRAVGCGCRYT